MLLLLIEIEGRNRGVEKNKLNNQESRFDFPPCFCERRRLCWSSNRKFKMTSFDIICGILLLYGVWRGWSDGIIVQLSGIIGLLLGGYLAWHYSEPVGRWIGAEDMLGQVAGFLIIFIVIVVLLAILGRMFRGMFRFAGLGIFDHLGGLLLGGIKVALLLYVLINTYESANQVRHWTSNKGIEQSFLYKPIKEVGELAFPYLQELRDQVLGS